MLTRTAYGGAAGRTARAGRKGKVTNFVAKKDQRIAGAIQAALDRNENLEDITIDGHARNGKQVTNYQLL